MNKTIILDLDDSLASMKERLQEIFRNETGDDTIHYSDWIDFHIKDRYGISNDKLLTLFLEDQTLEKLAPHEGVVEVTALMKSKGYNVEIVTARGWHPNAYNLTKKWLDDNYVSYDKINIVPLHQCKEEVTRHIDNIEIFLDDRLDYCHSMLKSGRVTKSLVYAQPWNEQEFNPMIKNMFRVNDLYEVLDHI